MRTCYIVGAGAFTHRDFAPTNDDFVIAADGGYHYLRECGVSPDLLLGDFDSLGSQPEDLPAALAIRRYPVEKNDTDTGIALETGFDLGYRDFRLFGCGGGRLDHLFANIQSMCRFQNKGAKTRLVDETYDIYALHNETLLLPNRPAGTLVSVFCQGERATGVNLAGLKYPLQNATLTCDYPLGVSNCYADQGEARVSVESGTLFVMVYCCGSMLPPGP